MLGLLSQQEVHPVTWTASYTLPGLTITPDLHPGYRRLRLRGRGAFGEVWEAVTDAGRPVALKFLPVSRGQSATHELRSIQLVRQLAHPHLTHIDRVWGAGAFLVVAMELADGSLADLLNVYRSDLGTAMPPGHLLPLLAQAAAGLDFLNNCQHYLHGQWVSVQHCDVKPPNLLVFGQTVKLTDFSLTTALAHGQKTHDRVGTPDYAAPEVFQGRLSDRTDQYALAVTYCLLRGGRLPFPDTPAGLAAGYVRPPPDLSMLPPAERPAIARALAPVPPDRWPSCGELIRRLEAATNAPPAGAPADRSERRQTPRFPPGRGIACAVQPTLGNRAWRAEVQNISSGGARLRILQPGCPLRPGRVLELTLVSAARGLRLVIQLRVTHSTEVEGGDHEVGGAFARPLTAEELAALGGGNSG
jgi:serine/threonine protein kinase